MEFKPTQPSNEGKRRDESKKPSSLKRLALTTLAVFALAGTISAAKAEKPALQELTPRGYQAVSTLVCSARQGPALIQVYDNPSELGTYKIRGVLESSSRATGTELEISLGPENNEQNLPSNAQIDSYAPGAATTSIIPGQYARVRWFQGTYDSTFTTEFTVADGARFSYSYALTDDDEGPVNGSVECQVPRPSNETYTTFLPYIDRSAQ